MPLKGDWQMENCTFKFHPYSFQLFFYMSTSDRPRLYTLAVTTVEKKEDNPVFEHSEGKSIMS